MFYYQKKNNKMNKFTDPVVFVSFYISIVGNYVSLFSLYCLNFFQKIFITKYVGNSILITFKNSSV